MMDRRKDDDQYSVSYWFCTGKSRDCPVYISFAKVFEHPSCISCRNEKSASTFWLKKSFVLSGAVFRLSSVRRHDVQIF